MLPEDKLREEIYSLAKSMSAKELEKAILYLKSLIEIDKVDIKDRLNQQKINSPALSKDAFMIGKVMVHSEVEVNGMDKRFHARELFHKVNNDLSLDQFNDGVLELEKEGLVSLVRMPGTEPFQFAYVLPTFMLFIIFEEELSFDPKLDVEKVLKIIEEVNFIDGLKLEKQSGLTVARINRAVDALENYKIVKTYRCMGTEPFNFAYAEYLKP
ncbi:MAG: hypothetical protein ACRKFN_12165 [Desulfitobacterium sp.]